MKTFELSGSSRTDLGKKATKAVRSEGLIPAVLYGGESQETIHFSFPSNSVLKLVYTPDVYLIDLTVDGKTQKSILKAIQFHPVTDAIMHMDFVRISEDKPTIIEIPVSLQGLAKGVKAGGRLSLDLRKLRVKALYNNLPERLNIDVTKLALGKTIQVKELSFENLEILNAANAVVCRVKATRGSKGAAADVEDDEEAEEAESAE